MSADWDDRGVRMPPGMGVIHWQGQILVYQTEDREIRWARPLGAAALTLSAELRAAIGADLGWDQPPANP